ncbi:MAG: DUF445 family protein [Candidatus Riflebacteria bacterium]|nr:DUF445 family protein [Candidatus Riflebacteria bacterium]
MDYFKLLINPITVGAFIGYLTNDVAVIMLFRPYRKMRLGWFSWQGLIPSRQDELASKIGEVITEQLLTSDKIANRMSDNDVLDTMENIFTDGLMKIFEMSEAPLKDFLSSEQIDLASEIIQKLLESAANSFEIWLKSSKGKEFLKQCINNLLSKKVSELNSELFSNQEKPLSTFLRDQFNKSTSSPSFSPRLKSLTSKLVVDFANSLSTFENLIPYEAQEALREEAIVLLPKIQSKIEEVIFSEENILKMRILIREAVESELNRQPQGPKGIDQIFSWGAKNLFKSVILQKVDEASAAQIPEFRKSFADPSMRNRLEKMVFQLINNYLKKTPGEVLTSHSPKTLNRIFHAFSNLLENWLESEKFSSEIGEYIENSLEKIKSLSLREILSKASIEEKMIESFSDELILWLEEKRIGKILVTENKGIFLGLLENSPSFFLKAIGREKAKEIFQSGAKKFTPLLSTKMPEILSAVDMQKIVRNEIASYPPEELEKLVLSVTKKELKTITDLGGVLGALIGMLQMLIS